ncbi:hypothetical protein BD414DRAFT_501589 [Trametes punicea]|nr:hypothetical protein BD414DRAFT_501589 [Trametes punicea]
MEVVGLQEQTGVQVRHVSNRAYSLLVHINAPRTRPQPSTTVLAIDHTHLDHALYLGFVNNMTSINNNDSPRNSPGGEYPEQRHAGAVGYGPEYGKGASTGDKLMGLKDEMKGKVLRKPDLVEHGREMRTGELKKKQQEEQNFDPFNTAGGSEGQGDEQKEGGGAGLQKQPPSGAESSDADKPNPPMSFPPAMSDTSHPTDKGAREQAASTAPEGTEKAQRQKSMGNTDKVAHYG